MAYRNAGINPITAPLMKRKSSVTAWKGLNYPLRAIRWEGGDQNA